ncbi:MAG: DUF4926 domain-containing protein [Acidimicrobiia bacterium]|nr:DUF4926 domain-containing protein [Acidimicrobiia bacterium]
MSEIVPFAVVRLLSGLPEYAISAGSLAVVLEVHSEPYEAYEVEIVDHEGRTVFAGAIDPAQCVVVSQPTPSERPSESAGEGCPICGSD